MSSQAYICQILEGGCDHEKRACGCHTHHNVNSQIILKYIHMSLGLKIKIDEMLVSPRQDKGMIDS